MRPEQRDRLQAATGWAGAILALMVLVLVLGPVLDEFLFGGAR